MTKTIETNVKKNDEYDICKDCVSHKEVYVYSELFVYIVTNWTLHFSE